MNHTYGCPACGALLRQSNYDRGRWLCSTFAENFYRRVSGRLPLDKRCSNGTTYSLADITSGLALTMNHITDTQDAKLYISSAPLADPNLRDTPPPQMPEGFTYLGLDPHSGWVWAVEPDAWDQYFVSPASTAPRSAAAAASDTEEG